MTRRPPRGALPALARRARGFGLFGLSVVLNGAVSLLTIPVVVAVAGADPWASMATGQSIGAWFGVLVIFGWGLTGPVSIAMADPARRPGLFLDSLFARAVLVLPLLLVQTAVTLAIVPQEKPAALLAGAAMMIAGVSANWYFTGESRADRFLLLDTVPRVSGTLAGVALVTATGELLLFALAQLTGSVVALVVSSAAIFRGTRLDVRGAARWTRIRGTLAEQRHGVVATGLLAAFMPAALAVVAVFSPALLPMFVLADRVGKFVQMAISPVLQVFQGWVPAATGVERGRRMRVAGLVVGGFAVVGGALYTVFLPAFSELLTHGEVVFTVAAAVAFGLNMTMAILSPYLTNIGLMAYGRLRTIAVSVAVGVGTALAGLALAETVAPDAAPWALVAGNVLVTVWQVVVLRREQRADGPLTPPLTPNNAEQITATADPVAARVP